MFVSGFTIARNVIKYDYPIKEAILSIEPLCDEIIVAVGESEDETRAYVQAIHPKVKIIDTVWDDSLREGGRVLALETNKALEAVSKNADWAFYIQADEVLHEQYIEPVKLSMLNNLTNNKVQGLLFDYLHFYGSYDFLGDSPKWYRREVRIIRPDIGIQSWGDAQGFRRLGKKLGVALAKGDIYHYGWVKHPKHQQLKQQTFHKLWHSDEWVRKNVTNSDEFDYSEIDALKKFEGRHPQVMKPRIDQVNWQFNFDPSIRKLSLKHRIKLLIENSLGWRAGEYKNYNLLKK